MNWLEFWEKVIGHVVGLAWPFVAVFFLWTQREKLGIVIQSMRIKSIEGFGGKIETQVDESTKLVAAATAIQLAPAEATIALEIPAFTARIEAHVEDAKPAVTERAGVVDETDADVIKPDTLLAKAIRDLDAAFKFRGGVGKSASLIKAIAISDVSPNLAINSAWSSVRAALQKVVVAWEGYSKQKFTVFDIDDDTLIGFAGQLGKLHPTLMLSIEQLSKICADVSSSDSFLIASSAARRYVENAAQVVDLIEAAVKK